MKNSRKNIKLNSPLNIQQKNEGIMQRSVSTIIGVKNISALNIIITKNGIKTSLGIQSEQSLNCGIVKIQNNISNVTYILNKINRPIKLFFSITFLF